MKFSMLPQPVGLLKFMLNLFCTNTTQGRKLFWRDFMNIKYMFNIISCGEHLWTDLFQNTTTIQLYSSFDDFDVYTRSYDYENTRNCAVILL